MKNSKYISKKKIYFWNLMGNLSAAGVSVLYLMIVSRLTVANEADKFSLSYSIGNLWVIIGMFQVRNYQGTDVQNSHTFASYFLARFISTTVMLVTILPYLQFSGYNFSDLEPIKVAILLILYRTCDAWSDLFQGQFQKHERLDIAGRSMTIRYALSTVILLFALLLTHSLSWSVFAVFIFNLIFVFSYDFSQSLLFEKIIWSELWKNENVKGSLAILKICLPLFINGFIVNLIFNEAKQAIESGLQNGILQEGMQRNYNILFMPAFFMSLCILIIRPLITDMAKLWSRKEYQKFDAINRKIHFSLLTGGLLISIISYLIGTPILSLIFGVDLHAEQFTLALLVFAGVLYSVALVLENVVTIFRMQKYLLFVYIAVYILAKAITYPLVAGLGLLGAALSFFIAMLFYAIGNTAVYLVLRKKLSY
ncbi:lipopolysaccharide biosynthesis protein [Streptococcus oricebi]|uniref:Polysaccharide biosynthesis protein n=1 Tax=Streptococcus oricebi TaxID=1547447 RepID=A0ABS5B0Z0_9STRE|nr:lipopolysaccharide biosynthesis protein [Streptococcus oricebi]MBP2622492.1 polysaccharide biosynthesis protein [Streptococcus oricebi]